MAAKKSDWPKEPLRLIHYQHGSDEGIKTFNPVKESEMTAFVNANSVHLDAEWSSGAYYDTKLPQLPKRPAIGDRDIVRESVKELHARGIKVFGYIQPWFRKEIAAANPDWIQRTKEKAAIKVIETSGGACVNSPWRDFSFAQMKEIVGDCGADGTFTDGPAFHSKTCYCRFCQEKFKARFGEPIPDGSDRTSRIWKEFLRWKCECIAEWVKDVKEAIRSVNPEAKFYMNAPGVNRLHTAEAVYLPEVGRYEDYIGAEAFMYYPDRAVVTPVWNQSLTAKYLQAASRVNDSRPTVVFITYSMRPGHLRPTPVGGLQIAISQTIANGSGIWLEVVPPILERSPEDAAEVRKIYGLFDEKKEFFVGTKSLAKVAILWSRNTEDFYAADPSPLDDRKLIGFGMGSEDTDKVFISSFLGACESLIRRHIPFDVIVDEEMTADALKRYGALVLPNSACLSDEQCEAIRGFVKSGGGLVATYQTSLYDEWGERREGLALADVLGAKLTGEGGGYMSTADVDHPVLKGIRKFGGAPWPAAKIEASDSATILARHDEGYEDKQTTPTLVANEFGSGRVVYAAGSLGNAYYIRTLPEFKVILGNAVEWVLADKRQTDVSAEMPELVEILLVAQEKENRVLAHLLNYTGEWERPLNRVLPLTDFRFRIKADVLGGKLRRASLLTTGAEIASRSKDGWLEFTLPRLEAYEAIVLEREK